MSRHRVIALLLFALPMIAGISLVVNQMEARPRQMAERYEMLEVDGTTRKFFLYLPTTNKDSARPLVIVLHPAGSSGRAMMALTDLNRTAEREGFIMIYPDSAAYTWDDGRSDAGMPPQINAVDDVGFIDALIDHAVTTYNADPAQVHLIGYREGGSMAHRLGCTLSDKVNSVMTVAAALWAYQQTICPFNITPTRTLMLYGDNDPVSGVNAQMIASPLDESRPFQNIGMMQTHNFWTGLNNCDADRVTGGGLLHTPDCAGDSTVTSYVMSGVAAIWPRINENFTLNQVGIDAAEISAAFINNNPDWLDVFAVPVQGEGRTRTYTLYVPAMYRADRATPLVLMLHLRPGSGSSFGYVTDMNLLADQHGFIVVYPDAINTDTGWYYFKGYEVRGAYPHDDSVFLTTLVDDLSRDLNIDHDRLYVAGMSNGGYMTQRLICDAPETFAAAAVISAAGFDGLETACANKPATPLLFMHGTADSDIAWTGEFGRDSVPQNMAFWADHNGCSLAYDLAHLDEVSDGPLEVYDYPGCEKPLELYAFPGGGHNWPGLPGRMVADFTGKVSTEINASEVIWDFFQNYQR